MAKKDGFRVTWEAEDGYVGGSRPHHVFIGVDELEAGMSESAIRDLFAEYIQEDFSERVSWTSSDEDDFVKWAQDKIAEMKAST